MMNEEVIVKALAITRIGERQHFQVSLPRDTKRITGFEYGAIGKDGEIIPGPAFFFDPGSDDFSLTVLPSKVIGKLILRADGCTGVFFQGDLVEDNNIRFGERVAPVLWQPQPWTHGRKRHEIGLSVVENNIVYGFFQDSWGAGEYESLSYTLNLYLWIEKCSV